MLRREVGCFLGLFGRLKSLRLYEDRILEGTDMMK